MAAGRKTGGRTKGTPNKNTRAIVEVLQELDCDPIEGMARIAMNRRNPPELRGRMFSELAQYMHPKRRSTEIAGPTGGPIKTSMTIRFVRAKDGKPVESEYEDVTRTLEAR